MIVRGLPHADMVIEVKAVVWCGPSGVQAGEPVEAGHAA